MAFQSIELNMIPHGNMPSFYASQYETGRPIIIDIMMGEDTFNCDELYVELHCRKVDDNIVTLLPDSIDGNTVTFIGTEQLLACPGKNLCEVCLYVDDSKDTSLGSLNFFIEVEPDPMAGGLTSESEIANLTTQIEQITEEVIGEDYYDKTEVDTLLADKADVSDLPDMTNYYNKSETNTLLNAKANTADLSTVATTGDYDDLLNKPTIPAAQVNSDWAAVSGVAEILNKPTIPTKTSDLNNDSDFQNETEVNNLIAEALLAVMPVDTATGNPCSFETEIAAPLVGCKATLVATGGGTPSDPVPIVGYSAVNLTANGTTHTISLGSTYYGGVLDVTRGKLRVTHERVDLGTLNWNTSWYSTEPPLGRIYAQISYKKNGRDNLICEAYPLALASDSYMGDLTITGNVGNKFIYIRDTSFNTGADLVASLNGVYLVYELATPIEVDVTPEQISALLGVNNISSDAVGDVEVEYKDSIQHYIDNR